MKRDFVFNTACRPFFIGLLTAGLLSACGGSGQSSPKAEAPAPQSEKPTPTPLKSEEEKQPAEEPSPKMPERKYEQWEYALDAMEHGKDPQWATVAQGMKPRKLVDGLEFLGVHTRVTGEDEYTFSLLFRPTKDLDADYHFILYGAVFPANTGRLAEGDRTNARVKLHRRLHDDPTSEWRQGEYHVVHVVTETAQIPYNIVLLAYAPSEDVFWNRVGERLDLGWQWAYRDEKAFIATIQRCKTHGELYALAPSGPPLSSSVANALDEKWGALTKGMEPQPLIDGLDILALDTKATGDKEYTFSFLLQSTADLDTDYHLGIQAGVDPSHIQHIEPLQPGAKSSKTWHLRLAHDPTSLWNAGEYRVAQLVVETEIIPYDISVFLRHIEQKNPGNKVNLGWQADVRE